MVTTEIQLTEEQMTSLKKEAQRKHISISILIQECISKNIVSKPPPIDKEKIWKRALAISGRFRSGLKDLSTNHDEYLDEVYNS
ncbi:MAG: CopG family transcriptional regulator [bacterium]